MLCVKYNVCPSTIGHRLRPARGNGQQLEVEQRRKRQAQAVRVHRGHRSPQPASAQVARLVFHSPRGPHDGLAHPRGTSSARSRAASACSHTARTLGQRPSCPSWANTHASSNPTLPRTPQRLAQWWKRRRPEKAMTILYSSAAATTSSSATEPPAATT